jgi:hypothetical protein
MSQWINDSTAFAPFPRASPIGFRLWLSGRFNGEVHGLQGCSWGRLSLVLSERPKDNPAGRGITSVIKTTA